jgi:hypothetical protein
MTKTDVDEAFEWLVLIIGIVSAIMGQYPKYFCHVLIILFFIVNYLTIII